MNPDWTAAINAFMKAKHQHSDLSQKLRRLKRSLEIVVGQIAEIKQELQVRYTIRSTMRLGMYRNEETILTRDIVYFGFLLVRAKEEKVRVCKIIGKLNNINSNYRLQQLNGHCASRQKN